MRIQTLDATEIGLETTQGGPYRQLLGFSLATGGSADGIEIHPQETHLGVTFSVEEYDAASGDGPVEILELEAKEQSLVVTLDAPRSIRRIRLASLSLVELATAVYAIEAGASSYDWGAVTFHKSLSAAAAPQDHTIKEMSPAELKHKAERDYGRGRAWSIPIVTLELYRVDGETISEQPTFTVANDSAIPETFVAKRFAVRGLDGAGDPVELEEGLLSELMVEGVPSVPRVGLGLNGAEAVEFFLTLPGEAREPGAWDALNVDAGAKLASVLDRKLQGLVKGLLEQAGDVPAPLPDPVSLSLVVESGAPCRFQLLDFAVAYSLIRERSSLLDGAGKPLPKAVLRFDGTSLSTQELTVQIPAPGQITSARLELDTSFGGAGNGLLSQEPEPLQALTAKGAAIEAGRWAVQGLVLEQALTVTDIALALISLEQGTELQIALEEDLDGAPSGRELAAGSLVLGAVGAREWMMLRLPEPPVLYSGLCWVSVRAAKGRALWLTGPANGARLRLFRRFDGEATRCLAALDDRSARALLYARPTAATAGRGPVALQLGGHQVAPSEQSGDTLVFDPAPALADQAEAAAGPLPIQLQFSSALAGQVTVYPPRIQYDLPE